MLGLGRAFQTAPRALPTGRAAQPKRNRIVSKAEETTPASHEGSDFIRDMVRADLDSGKHQQVVTRFPPEPNGYLHIGHAKAICLNFGVAAEMDGRCHLRFDDTNPTTEDPEFVEAIQRDIAWLGFDWGEHLYFASDYFERMAELAEKLIRKGKAYVDSSTLEEIRERRGTVTEHGTPGPYRDRSVEENLDLFRCMRAGEFDDGAHVLRGKIDLTSPNMQMRDPVLYRIRKAHHYRQGDAWCIYPMYDYAHCLEDAFEGVTHSLCSLEFENNRELYDWVIRETEIEPPVPEQTEFARLNLGYTVMSKRKLLQLVKEDRVDGWNDPRMPTLAGMRRRGYTPESIRNFCKRVGVARNENLIDLGLLEFSVRDDLNHKAPRVMAVLDPLKVVLTNHDGETEWLDASYWPHDVPKEGSRQIPFGKELWIERSDFMEEPVKGFHRLAPGREVRLRYGYFIRCEDVIKNDEGEIVELRCTYDAETRGGNAPDGRKVKGTIHWLAAAEALPAEVRLYDRLFKAERPEADGHFLDNLNPGSLDVVQAYVEPSLKDVEPESWFQFERQGFFFTDPELSKPGALVFNRTVTLRDTWAAVAEAVDPEQLAAERAAAREAEKELKRKQSEQGKETPLTDEEQAVYERYAELGVQAHDARSLALDADLRAFFDAAFERHGEVKSVSRWLTTELGGRLGDRALTDLPFGGDAVGELAALVDEGKITNAAGKKVLDILVEKGGSPAAIVEAEGLAAVTDTGELEKALDEVLAQNAAQFEAYRGGKKALFGFFMGQAMRATGGKGDPGTVKKLLQAKLDG